MYVELVKWEMKNTKCNNHLASAAVVEECIGSFFSSITTASVFLACLCFFYCFGSVLSSFWNESKHVNGDADLFLDGVGVWELKYYSV